MSPEQIFPKVNVFGAKILPKLEETGPEYANFFGKQKMEGR